MDPSLTTGHGALIRDSDHSQGYGPVNRGSAYNVGGAPLVGANCPPYSHNPPGWEDGCSGARQTEGDAWRKQPRISIVLKVEIHRVVDFKFWRLVVMRTPLGMMLEW